MKRKMIGAAAAYMAGLFFASFYTMPPLLIMLSAAIAAALIAGRRYGFKAADHVMMACFFAAAAAAFYTYSGIKYYPVVCLDGENGSFSGEVAEARHFGGDNSSYILKGRINGRINAKVSFYSDSVEADLGDFINIESCKFEKPSSDFMFDGESYYKADGVFLSITDSESVSVEHSSAHSLKRAINDYRERIISDFRIALGDDSGDMLAGMVFGEKRGMDQNLKTAFYRCGIGHILAVSGLHVSVAVFLFMLLLKRFNANRFVSFAVMEVILIFLIVMANYPVSAVRAAVMMNFLYASKLFRRQNDTFNSLAGAVLLICIAQPYVIYDRGFILSVAGTFGIGVFAPFMTENMKSETARQKLLVDLVSMLCTTLCVFPFSLMYFNETSLISPFMNILTVPLCSVSMTVGLIYAFTGGVIDLLYISKYINAFVLGISDRLARLEYTHFSCSSKAVMAGLIIGAFLVVLCAAVFRNRQYIAVSITVALVFMFAGSGIYRIQRTKTPVVAVLGKGSNAAVVFSYAGCTDVIDLTGHHRSAGYVRKYLQLNDTDRVDSTVLTKRVQAGYASYSEALEYVKVGQWYVNGDIGIAGSDNKVTCLGDNPFTFRIEDSIAKLEGGRLTVEFSDTRLIIAPVSAYDEDEGGMWILYGKSKDDSYSDRSDVICLEETNNLEIEISGKGRYKVRRL